MADAIARHRALLARHPSSELARFGLAKALVDVGQSTEARDHLEFCLQRKPDWMVAWMLRGHCDLALGDRRSARAAFSTARELALAQNHEGPLAEIDARLGEL